MTLTLLFFGATADEVGTRSKRIDAPDTSRVSDAVELILADHPNLRRHKLLFSVNQEYVSEDATLKGGDEIAIFTAVSGG
jgi:molybdopterin converting factor small subunit